VLNLRIVSHFVPKFTYSVLTVNGRAGMLSVTMENRPFTIEVWSKLIEGAENYARRRNTTLAKLVTACLHQLVSTNALLDDAPIVQRLSGVLSQDVSLEDYHLHLEEKHLNK
jgi:hypothetical protein